MSLIDEFEISKRVEYILTNEGRGGRMIVAFNTLPLFLTSNSKPINHFLLNGSGSLEILTQNPSALYNNPWYFSDYSIMDGHRIDRGEIEVYKTERRIKSEFAVLWNYVIFFYNKKFGLTENIGLAKKHTRLYEWMKRAEFVKDFGYIPPSPLVRT